MQYLLRENTDLSQRVYNNMRRGISGLLIIGVAAGFLAGCGRGRQPIAKKQVAKEEKTALKAEFRKAAITWADAKGRPVMEARFREAVASTDAQSARVELLGVKATLYQNGRPASSLSAERVVADSRIKEISASGNVIVTSADGSSAQSERVVWRSSANKLVGLGGVKLIKGNVTITADRFEADTSLKTARFYDGRAEIERRTSNIER